MNADNSNKREEAPTDPNDGMQFLMIPVAIMLKAVIGTRGDTASRKSNDRMQISLNVQEELSG